MRVCVHACVHACVCPYLRVYVCPHVQIFVRDIGPTSVCVSMCASVCVRNEQMCTCWEYVCLWLKVRQ